MQQLEQKHESDRINKGEQIRKLFYARNSFQHGIIPLQSKQPVQLSLLSFPSVVTGIISLSLHSKTNPT